MYGWSPQYPLSALTVSGTAAKYGINNTPTDPTVLANLSRVSDFLATLPFTFRIGSGYRSPEVNQRVGGAGQSQHMQGEAVDFTPLNATNEDVANWLYQNHPDHPELDQVIWYTDTGHVHVSVGGRRRGEFLKGTKEGSSYIPWAPTYTGQAKMAGRFLYNRPFQTALWTVTTASVVLVAANYLFGKKTPQRALR